MCLQGHARRLWQRPDQGEQFVEVDYAMADRQVFILLAMIVGMAIVATGRLLFDYS